MKAVLTLAVKDLRLLSRDRLGFFFTLFFPLVYAIFFGMLFSGASGGPSEIGIAVVDEDLTPASEAFIERLNGDEALAVHMVGARDAAADMVRRGERAAYVVVPKGYGVASEQIFWGEPMRVEIGVDPGRAMTAGMLEGLVTAHAFEEMQRVFQPGYMEGYVERSLSDIRASDDLNVAQRSVLESLMSSLNSIHDVFPAQEAATQAAEEDGETGVEVAEGGFGGWQPIEVTTTKITDATGAGGAAMPTSSFAVCFPQGILWGVMACAATFAASIIAERSAGTLPRLTIAPLARWQILAGKALACFLTTVGLIVVLLLVAWVVFGVVPGSVSLLAVAILSVAFGIVGLMMVLAVLGKTEQAVAGISWAVVVVMAMLGGGMVPLMLMPEWMRTLGHVSVVKWSILALEGAIWRGFSPGEMALPVGVLVGLGVIGFVIGVSVFRWSEEH